MQPRGNADWLKRALKVSAATWIVGLALTTALIMNGQGSVAVWNLRSIVDLVGGLAIVLAIVMVGRTLWRKYTKPLAPRIRPSPRREMTAVGQDMSTLIRFAAMIAAETINDQRTAFDKEHGRDKEPGRNSSIDHRLRFATDDFVVGYAVGVATLHVLINGRESHEIPMEALLFELQSRLSTSYPNLDCATTYRGGSNRLSCGIFFGLRERGDTPHALRWVLDAMSPFALGPEIELCQFAYECGASFAEGELVRVACQEMRARYGS
jgi:hypothetical protein